MHILIDDQVPIEVNPIMMSNEDHKIILTLTFDDTSRVLDTWQELNVGRRGYRYGQSDDDGDPSTIIIAEATRHGLNLDDVDPHWDGVGTHNAYALEALAGVLPLKWGDEIGEGVNG